MGKIRKIVIAVDSFKGSVSSQQAAKGIEKGILKVLPECKVEKFYTADGGEGTVEALIKSLGGEKIKIKVHDPLMRPIQAIYGIINNGTTAVIEMASASGLSLLEPSERNPLITDSFGTGEIIADALKQGCRNIIIGIGGSATNDAGIGMLRALGYIFRDKKNNIVKGGGENLLLIETIDTSAVLPELLNAKINVACDVNNPFCGKNGAARVFALQKGASVADVELLDNGMQHFAEIINRSTNIDITSLPGAGAAGGMGGTLMAILGATLKPGIDLILSAMDFEHCIENADLIFTGEGKLDNQTLMGKASYGILKAAEKKGIPVIALGGAVEGSGLLCQKGFTAVFPIIPAPVTLKHAMDISFTEENLCRTAEQILRTIVTLSK